MEKINLYFIHGFLGLPSDWHQVQNSLGLGSSQYSLHNVNLWDDLAKIQPLTFENWAQKFCEKVQSQRGRNILVGYSLGGRLAMMCLQEQSSLWDQVFLVSANLSYKDDWQPGQILTSERASRKDHDQRWAQRFSKENWSEVLRDWNAQEVFVGSVAEPVREEKQFDRLLVQKMLSSLSQAFHRNMRPAVAANSQKVWAFVGEEDKKYRNLWQDFVQEQTDIHLDVIAGSGHRILFDQPKILAAKIKEYLVHQK